MSADKDHYCLRTVNVGTTEGDGVDSMHFSLWFGRNIRVLSSYGCVSRAFNKMFKAAFGSREHYQHCKVYVLLPTDNRNITIPSMPKSELTGDKFVRSCYEALLPDIQPGCVWLVRCIWQPGTYPTWIHRYITNNQYMKWLTDKQLDGMDLLMSRQSISMYPVIDNCECY